MKPLFVVVLLLIQLYDARKIYFNHSSILDCAASSGGCYWDNPIIWNDGRIPTSLSDDVFITPNISYPLLIIVDGTFNLGNLQVQGKITIQISNSSSLAIDTDLQVLKGK